MSYEDLNEARAKRPALEAAVPEPKTTVARMSEAEPAMAPVAQMSEVPEPWRAPVARMY
jgi:hypothetical protein